MRAQASRGSGKKNTGRYPDVGPGVNFGQIVSGKIRRRTTNDQYERLLKSAKKRGK